MNKLSGNTDYFQGDNQYDDQVGNYSLVGFLIMQCLRWIFLLCFVDSMPFTTYEDLLSAVPYQFEFAEDGHRVHRNIERVDYNDQDGTKETPVEFTKRFMDFLPISAVYFVKNPTTEQANSVRNKVWTEEEKLCKVCYINNGNTIVNACGHGGMCDGCAKEVFEKFGNCMICKQKIDKIFVVRDFTEGKIQVIAEFHER